MSQDHREGPRAPRRARLSGAGRAAVVLVVGAAANTVPLTTGPDRQATAATTREVVVVAQADTVVRQADPTASFGSATTLLSDTQELATAGSAAHTYLRFDVTGIAAGETVTAARVDVRTLPTDGGTTDGPAVYRTGDTSSAATAESMTWNGGRPSRVGGAVGDFGAMGADVRVGTAVSGVTGNGLVSLELAPDSSNGMRIRSREHATSSYRPRLVLTVTSGGGDGALAHHVGGRWTTPIAALPQRTVHAAVMHTGKVLLVAGSGNREGDFDAGTFKSLVWDPATNALTELPNAPFDFFCAGHSFLPDGRLLIAGGTSVYENQTQQFGGTNKAAVFDPATQKYTLTPNSMVHSRWYPTVLNTGDGKILAVSGRRSSGSYSNSAEQYDIATGRWTQSLITQTWPNYPHLVLLDDGRLFYSGLSHRSGAGKSAGFWDVGRNTFTAVPGLTTPARRHSGGTVLLPPAQDQKVMVMGGGDREGSISDANIIDTKAASPAYQRVPDIPFSDGSTGSMHLNAVLLPDGTVFETGGARVYQSADVVKSSAVFHPTSRTWTQMNPNQQPRGYHSSAVLLPDGRVATMGHDLDDVDVADLSLEIWEPPYLFKGPRPTLDSATTEVRYGGSFDVTAKADGTSTLTKFVLAHPSAVTHSLDPDQRIVDVPFTATASGARLTLPSNRNLAPAGWYMLFAVDSQGRPSVADWVHLG